MRLDRAFKRQVDVGAGIIRRTRQRHLVHHDLVRRLERLPEHAVDPVAEPGGTALHIAAIGHNILRGHAARRITQHRHKRLAHLVRTSHHFGAEKRENEKADDENLETLDGQQTACPRIAPGVEDKQPEGDAQEEDTGQNRQPRHTKTP